MHSHDLSAFAHRHAFGDAGARQRERALAAVTAITLLTMVAELVAGYWSGSLALTADGWHMGTHALALGGAVLAYRLSARASGHAAYAFGGWKIEVLSAYTSGLLLMAVALWLVFDSIAALRAPHPIAYGEAMAVAVIGLAVNVASAWLLARGARRGHAEHDDHGAAHPGHAHHHHHDHNFSAAYVHVLADAFTSVLAIGALAGGLWFGWRWLDPAVALVGAAVIAQWAIGVLRHSARALVDATSDPQLAERIRRTIESDGDAKLADLHVWQVGARAWTVVLSVVADRPLDAMVYRQRLEAIDTLEHVTVEVHRCPGAR
jgi:cation diffusion facilitator family transporter